MGIHEDQFFQLAKPHFARTWESLHAGYQRHAGDPLRMYYRTSSKATCANDLMFAELVSSFDGIPGVKPHEDSKNHLRFICIDDRVLFWLKKVDAGRIPANYPTEAAEERLDGQATIDGFPGAAIIVVGYLPNADETEISRISFMPPFRQKPEWFFDLVPMGNVTQMGQPRLQQAAAKFKVLRGPNQEAINL
jgi:hypothetical protein